MRTEGGTCGGNPTSVQRNRFTHLPVQVWFKNRRAKERKKSRDGRNAENANSTGSNASDGGTIQISEESDCEVSDDNESAVASPPPTAVKRKCAEATPDESRPAEKRSRQEDHPGGGRTKAAKEEYAPQQSPHAKDAVACSRATLPVNADSVSE